MPTYKAILKGDRVEWMGAAPETNGGVAVEITVLSPAPDVDDATRRQRILEALNALAARGTYAADVTDPVEWQREIRKDRPLPGREE
jgi:hypothetical protein